MAGKIPRVSRTFIVVFIDLRTASDNINRRRLYEKRAQQGRARKIVDWKEGVCQTMVQLKIMESLRRYLNYVVDEINAVD
jgi:hypothetical protein